MYDDIKKVRKKCIYFFSVVNTFSIFCLLNGVKGGRPNFLTGGIRAGVKRANKVVALNFSPKGV